MMDFTPAELREGLEKLTTSGLILTSELPTGRSLFRLSENNGLFPGHACLSLFFIGTPEQEEQLFQVLAQHLGLLEVASGREGSN